ncbi:putative transferase CAF17 homolog, mitochondrial [Diabrotica undecimpunctata]|uniref:putative transferase CAF17 homolog, mitochondrial n=1 Tax=Diabrotica undecimpunctata TaxID=50387 RepID=UPI003B63345B
MLQLSKIFNITNIRFCSNVATRTILEPLKNRSLIHVSGNDSTEFLQGLVTNDINHLRQNFHSMYAMFLNTKGRVLYDSIIYKFETDNSYFIECDLEIEKQLEKHLKMYRVRKKVDITNTGNEYQIYVLFRNNCLKTENVQLEKNKVDSSAVQESVPLQTTKKLFIFKDPRVPDLGYRIIAKNDVDIEKEISSSVITESPTPEENYKYLRYSLGIGEGVNDLPVGNCFPLECNCDYLHGVSFHKGCYIGQELTARTHHTGVVRKRLMPLLFIEPPNSLPNDNVLKSDQVNLGKLRGTEQNLGLALLRIESALNLSQFKVGNGLAKVWKPHWWPLELPKEKQKIQKT